MVALDLLPLRTAAQVFFTTSTKMLSYARFHITAIPLIQLYN